MSDETLVDGWKALDIDPESLRGRVVEAGARKFYELMTARSGSTLTFDVAYPDEQADFLRVTAQVVDSVLDCLTENADEWAEETRIPTLVGGDALALIAVLRGETGDTDE